MTIPLSRLPVQAAAHPLRAQAEELAVLQDEVERLRLRTFPSFVERTDTVRLPDIRVSTHSKTRQYCVGKTNCNRLSYT